MCCIHIVSSDVQLFVKVQTRWSSFVGRILSKNHKRRSATRETFEPDDSSDVTFAVE